MKRIIELVGIFILMTLAVVSCKKDNSSDDLSSQDTKIILSLDDMPVVETRSTASTNERWITDAYVLVFGTDNKYKAGERVDVAANVVDNGLQEPVLTTKLLIDNGDSIVVLCNTGVSSLPSFTKGESTIADINEKFPSGGWDINQTGNDSGKGMPMSGSVVYYNTSKPKAHMYRSVAKVQLLLNIPAGADKTGSFTADATQWGMYNVVQEGDIYSVNGAMSWPSTVTFNDVSSLPQRVVGASGATKEQLTYYMPEYPNATYAKTTSVAASSFSTDRTCMIVHTSAGYYRLDLALGNLHSETKDFLDINRNSHYKVTITKVNCVGYHTATEALGNPSSNLEYEIVITGDNDNYVKSNGQYALISNKREIVLLDNINDNTLDFSLKTVEALNITTAYAEIVDATKTVQVAMPDCFTVKKSGVEEEFGVQSNVIPLGTLTGDTEFSLKANLTLDVLPTVSSLEGCYIHIVTGNIDRYIPISISPIVNLDQIVLYSGTSNCYEVPTGAPSTHTIDITPYMSASTEYENIMSGDLATPRSAEMLWSDVSSNHITDVSVSYDSINNKYSLTYTASGAAGNAVIAIYDKADPTASDAKIMWSFHIWINDHSATNDQLWSVINTTDRTVVHDKYYMMDRNLGATSNNIPTETDNSCYGLYYQWGRKDPFVGGETYTVDGGRKTIYSPTGTTTQEYVVSTPEIGTIRYAVEHPKTFIIQGGSATRQDWLYAASIQNLWGNPSQQSGINYYPRPAGKKSIYDPCPEGYCVPPQDAFTIMVKTGSFLVSGNPGIVATTPGGRNIVLGWSSTVEKGARFYCQDMETGLSAYLPFAGYLSRDNGAILGLSTSAFYWTNSSITKTNPQATRNSFGNSTWNPIWTSGRAMGHSVRCMREIK